MSFSVNKIFILGLMVITFSFPGKSQNPTPTKNENVGNTFEDSIMKQIDSLIKENHFTYFYFENGYNKINNGRRQYFYDSTNNYLVKAIIDTCFQDFYKTTSDKVILYFHHGYLFRLAFASEHIADFNLNLTVDLENSTSVRPLVAEFEFPLRKDCVDETLKEYVRTWISKIKWAQRKYGND